MSTLFDNKNLLVSGAIASLAVVGSIFLYNRMANLEEKLKEKNARFDKLIAEMEARTQDLRSGGGSPDFREALGASTANMSESDAKLATVQMQMKGLEKLMQQMIGGFQMQANMMQPQQVGRRMSSHYEEYLDNVSDAADRNRKYLTATNTALVYYHRGTTNTNFEYNINSNKREKPSNISRICLTGGPCAGKTTAIAAIK